MKLDFVATPRPLPSRLIPATGAVVALALSLALFLVAGWPIRGWALGAILWVGLTALSLGIAHMRSRTDGVASSSLQGIELLFKALIVLGVILAAAQSDSKVAVGAILVYALAYTVELTLSVASYFGTDA